MDTLTLLRALAQTTKRTEKETLLTDAFAGGHREFFVAARLALDPLVSFGVQKVPEIVEEDDFENELPFLDFLKLTKRLKDRELTGHAARDAIRDACERTDFATWNLFYRRILLKDFKVGVDASTINKVLKKLTKTNPEAKSFTVPMWSPQLAQDGTDQPGQLAEKHMRGEKLLDTKFDGARLVTFLDVQRMTVTQYTREGRVNENFPHIRQALSRLLPHLPGGLVFDGEITAGSFQELMEQLNTKDVANDQTKLAVFDIIPLADYLAGECKTPQEERHETMVSLLTSDLYREHVGDIAYPLPKVKVDFDTDEGRAAYEAFLTETSRAAKSNPLIEGVMVKCPRAPYRSNGTKSWVRNDGWLKVKPVISVTLECVGVEEGKPNGKNAGKLGGLVLEGVDDGKQIRVVCGGGLSDQQREEWWADPSKVIGYLFEVEADKLSRPKNSDVWSLRFPRLKGRRGTTPGEKI